MQAQAQPREPHSLKDVDTKRRFFIRSSVKLLPYLGAGTLIYPLVRYVTYEEVGKISMAIPLSQIKTDITKIEKVLIQKKDEEFIVFSAHCTHMGCILNIDVNKNCFVCPCHSSEFSYDGERLKGPAKRNLDIIPSYVKDKILYIG